jgi:hypothetical protein
MLSAGEIAQLKAEKSSAANAPIIAFGKRWVWINAEKEKVEPDRSKS